jgi:hypothetical protein
MKLYEIRALWGVSSSAMLDVVPLYFRRVGEVSPRIAFEARRSSIRRAATFSLLRCG